MTTVKWKWLLRRVDTFDPKLDIDARRIAATARKYVTRVMRAIAKNYDMDDSSERSTIADGVTKTSFDKRVAESNEEDDSFDAKSHMYEYVAESREEDDRFNEITLSTLDDAGTTGWNNVVISVPSQGVVERPSVHISTRYPRSTTFPPNPRSVDPVAKRLDRESRLLNHLWSLYVSKCNGRFDEHATKCIYGQLMGERDELGYHVRIALLNLLDADDTERLLQLGCILLLRATNQFPNELASVFESTIDDYVVCERLRRIDALCTTLEANGFSERIEESINTHRRVLAAMPRPRSSTDRNTGAPLHAATNSSYWRVTKTRTRSIAPMYPTSLGLSQHLNRCCGSNGICVDTIDPILLTNDGLESEAKVARDVRHYVRNAWTERRTLATSTNNVASTKSLAAMVVSTVLLIDGSVITYVDNYDGEREVVVPLRRIAASEYVKLSNYATREESEPRDLSPNRYNERFEQHIATFDFDFQRLPTFARVHIDARYKIIRGSHEHVKVDCFTIGNVDVDGRWFVVRAVVPANSRAVFVTRQLLPDAHRSLMFLVRNGGYVNGPVVDKTWLQISPSMIRDDRFVDVLVDDRCVVTFDGWIRDRAIDFVQDEILPLRSIGLYKVKAVVKEK